MHLIIKQNYINATNCCILYFSCWRYILTLLSVEYNTVEISLIISQLINFHCCLSVCKRSPVKGHSISTLSSAMGTRNKECNVLSPTKQAASHVGTVTAISKPRFVLCTMKSLYLLYY